MTIKHLFPPAWPTLNLDFANSKALDPRITFTRSSIGTYVDADGILQTAVDDEPRFDHDPVTGECLGLLIEESRTNMIKNSLDGVGSVSYPNEAPIVTPNATDLAAPDGTFTATRVQVSRCNYISTSGWTGVANEKGTFSYWIYPKSISGNRVEMYIINYGKAKSVFVPVVLNRWQRISITSNNDWDSNGPWVPSVMRGASDIDAYFWGFQGENAAFPTSYIATAGAAETRSADVATITGDDFSSWYNPSASTWYAEGDQLKTDANGDQDEQSSMFVDRYSNTGLERFGRTVWRVKQARNNLATNTNTPATPKGSKAKTAFALDTVNVRFAVGGSLSPVGVLGAYPGTTEFRLAKDTSLGVDLNGHISRIAYYPTRLPDEQLQALTA